MVAIRQTCG